MKDTYLKSKILIVDDEECLRSMLITILKDENFYNIVTADCVKSALKNLPTGKTRYSYIRCYAPRRKRL